MWRQQGQASHSSSSGSGMRDKCCVMPVQVWIVRRVLQWRWRWMAMPGGSVPHLCGRCSALQCRGAVLAGAEETVACGRWYPGAGECVPVQTPAPLGAGEL
mmetsp:Transcript_7647/g.20363  ORF Transcript_7647/g.20363 Transcript_7647/m.20363 type:complete len:101 (+) Transcript_7647:2114-2416(+)